MAACRSWPLPRLLPRRLHSQAARLCDAVHARAEQSAGGVSDVQARREDRPGQAWAWGYLMWGDLNTAYSSLLAGRLVR